MRQKNGSANTDGIKLQLDSSEPNCLYVMLGLVLGKL